MDLSSDTQIEKDKIKGSCIKMDFHHFKGAEYTNKKVFVYTENRVNP